MKLPRPQRVFRTHIPTLGDVARSLQYQKQLAEAELHNLKSDFELVPKRFEEDIHFKIDQIYVGVNSSDDDFEKIHSIRLIIYNEYCSLDERLGKIGLTAHLVVAIINICYIILLVLANCTATYINWTDIPEENRNMFQFQFLTEPRTDESSMFNSTLATPTDQTIKVKMVPNHSINNENIYLKTKIRTITSLSLCWYFFFFVLSYFIPAPKDWILYHIGPIRLRLQKRTVMNVMLVGTSLIFGITAAQLVDELYFKTVNGLVPAVSEMVVAQINAKIMRQA